MLGSRKCFRSEIRRYKDVVVRCIAKQATSFKCFLYKNITLCRCYYNDNFNLRKIKLSWFVEYDDLGPPSVTMHALSSHFALHTALLEVIVPVLLEIIVRAPLDIGVLFFKKFHSFRRRGPVTCVTRRMR